MEFHRYIPDNYLYRLQRDETLTDVAQRFKTSINNIEPLTVGEIKEGEFVKIKQSNEFEHSVAPLETLKDIAEKYKVSEEEIITKNNLKIKRLFIGQKLRF